MGDFVTEIVGKLTIADLWSTVAPIAAIVATLVIFKLGYRVLKDNVNNATKPKGRAMK